MLTFIFWVVCVFGALGSATFLFAKNKDGSRAYILTPKQTAIAVLFTGTFCVVGTVIFFRSCAWLVSVTPSPSPVVAQASMPQPTDTPDTSDDDQPADSIYMVKSTTNVYFDDSICEDMLNAMNDDGAMSRANKAHEDGQYDTVHPGTIVMAGQTTNGFLHINGSVSDPNSNLHGCISDGNLQQLTVGDTKSKGTTIDLMHKYGISSND